MRQNMTKLTKLTKKTKLAKKQAKVVRKKISWKTALNCAKAQCTMKEIAAILDVCENTLRERCLRRKLFRMAQGDNFPALKFALGNYLKMYEKNELVVAAKYVQYTDEEREMLRKLAMEKAQKELEQGQSTAKAVVVPNLDEPLYPEALDHHADELDEWEKV
jgi:hypothetical protein